MTVTMTSEAQSLVEELDPVALAAAAEPPESEDPPPARNRRSLLAFSLLALAINGSAACYTMPSDLSLPEVGNLAGLIGRQSVSPPKPDPVLAALHEIQAAQQQHAASLQENNYVLQQSVALRQQDSSVLLSLRQSITDERIDVKKVSAQLSALMTKIDSLQSALVSDITSSIARGPARNRLSAFMLRKRMARESRPVGPVSVGGAPLSMSPGTSDPDS